MNKNPYKQPAYLMMREQAALIVKSGHGVCGMCGGGIPPTPQGGMGRRGGDASQWSIDHTTPLALGGLNEPSNMRLVHARCNSSGGGKLGGRWRTRKRKHERSNKFTTRY